MQKSLCCVWMILFVLLTNGFGYPDLLSTRPKIKWENNKIYFPGPVNHQNTNKFYDERYHPSTPDKDNDIKNEEPSCVLTADPPTPESHCCGVEAVTVNKIVGGDVTQLEQYPWLVHIQYYNKKQDRNMQLCGGFLISGRYVLSAAHCFIGEILGVGTPVNVILGDYNTTHSGPDCTKASSGTVVCTDGEIKVPIESYLVHPKHHHDNITNIHDIALVRLGKTVEWSQFIRPICLPSIDVTSSPSPDLRLHSAGWGAIKQRLVFELGRKTWAGEYDYVKRHVSLPIKKTEKCLEHFPFLNSGHICAGGERGKDSCRGDSGGPLMYNNNGIFEAVGVVSTGVGKHPCGTEGLPAVYTNVVQYLDWIKDNIKP